MSGLAALSVNQEMYGGRVDRGYSDRKFVGDLFWLTFYHQHLGQEYGGLAALTTNEKGKKEKILLRTHRGLFRSNFENDLAGF